MCGIVGVVSADASLRSGPVVRHMLQALSHRGPDDEGVEMLEGASLGARRLSIIDLQGGHQPIGNEDGSVVAVQNGEIYNFVELRDQLKARGHRFRSRSDTEVLPHAWEEWGERLGEHLRGMFAIAVWDARAHSLFLVRDRFGKKPLVYASLPGLLVFASEIQALLRHPAVRRDVDEQAIADYLALGYVPAPRSGFASIHKLLPAHGMLLKEGTLSLRRYWTLHYEPKLRISQAEASEEFRRRVDEAVRARMVSDVPLGAFLSGGLDSSTVVAFMARHSGRPVKTFSIGFRERRFDETAYARAVAHAFGTEHHELVVDANDAGVLPMLVRHLGEPFADSSILPTYQVARITRPHVTVVLNGDGGDELLGGYDRYRGEIIAGRLQGGLGVAARSVATLAASVRLPRALPPTLHKARRFAASIHLGSQQRYARWMGYFGGELHRRVAGERLARCELRLADEHLVSAGEVTGAASGAERYIAADVLFYLPNDLLVKMDIATMACSLEARSPLLDHELHEFVAQLPLSYKLSIGASKILLRRAMRGIVPDTILDRRLKMGFGAPVGDWLRGPLRGLFSDTALSPAAAARGFVNVNSVKQLFDEHATYRTDRSAQLWNVLMLELWFREVVEQTADVAQDARPVVVS